MSDPSANDSRLLLLAEKVCDESASEDDIFELDSLLETDASSRHAYWDYCRMHISLEMEMQASGALERMQCEGSLDAISLAPWESEALAAPTSGPSPAVPITILSGNPFGSVLDYVCSGWPMAYSLATLIVGIGIAIAAVTHVSIPTDVATPSDAIPSSPSTLASAVVGRITGVANCKWSAGNSSENLNSPVSLGDRFDIRSGLLEITYDTGAKVLLQGPVTYEVESQNGGFMAIGKLTGKVTTEAARGLAIRTPTAIVTDLGTEFGVKVDKSGSTTSHVFRGSVEVRPVSADNRTNTGARVLHANESARVENKANQHNGNCVSVLPPSAKSIDFVREISKRSTKTLDQFEAVAIWRFDDAGFLADSSGNGHTLVSNGATQLDNTAFFNGNAIMHTVNSIDLTAYAKVRVSWSQKVNDTSRQQMLWEHTTNFTNCPGAFCNVVCDVWGGSRTASAELHTRGNAFNIDNYAIRTAVWEDFVVEYCRESDQGTSAIWRGDVVRVFKDGKPIGTATVHEDFAPDSFQNAWFYIGARAGTPTPILGFTGQIDNLKIEGKRK